MARSAKTILMTDFSAGIDRREGTYGPANSFFDLINGYVSAGRNVSRRPGLLRIDGAFGSDTSGLIEAKSASAASGTSLFTFAPIGSANAQVPAGVQVLWYDLPASVGGLGCGVCSPGSEAYQNHVVIGEVVVALLKHAVPAAQGGGEVLWLHVFDNASDLPTWWTDHACPWGPATALLWRYLASEDWASIAEWTVDSGAPVLTTVTSRGVHVFEFRLDAVSPPQSQVVGLGQPGSTRNFFPGSIADEYGFDMASGVIYPGGGAGIPTGIILGVPGDVLGVILDFDLLVVEWWKNGVYITSTPLLDLIYEAAIGAGASNASTSTGTGGFGPTTPTYMPQYIAAKGARLNIWGNTSVWDNTGTGNDLFGNPLCVLSNGNLTIQQHRGNNPYINNQGRSTISQASSPGSEAALSGTTVISKTFPLHPAEKKIELGAYIGGTLDRDDQAIITVTIYNGAGVAMATTLIGPVTSTDRDGATTVLYRYSELDIPQGSVTAKIECALTSVDAGASQALIGPLDCKIRANNSTALTTVSQKIFGGRQVDGNAGFSKVFAPRFWNTRTQLEVSNNGLYYYIRGYGSQDLEWIIPLPYAGIFDGTFPSAHYGSVLQLYIGPEDVPDYDSEKNWGPYFEEIASGAPTAGQVRYETTPTQARRRLYSTWTVLRALPGVAANRQCLLRLSVAIPNGTVDWRKRFPISGGINRANLAASTYENRYTAMGTGGDSQFELPDDFWFIDAAGWWVVTVNGGAALTYDASIPIAAGSFGLGKRIVNGVVKTVIIIGTISAAGDIVDIRQQYLNGLKVGVPPCTIRTPDGDKRFAGGYVTLADNTNGQQIFISFGANLTQSETPDGTVFAVALGAAPLSGQLRYQHVYQMSCTTLGGIVNSVYFLGGADTYYTATTADIQGALATARSVAGDGEAGFLPTANQDRSNGMIQALHGSRSKLLVAYSSSSQMWQVSTDTNNDAILDISPIGAGIQSQFYQDDAHPRTSGAIVQASLFIAMDGTYRLIDPGSQIVGSQFQNMMSNRYISEPITGLGQIVSLATTWWQAVNAAISASIVGGVFQFLCLTYRPADKVIAWSRWTTPLANISRGSFVPIGNRLYMRSSGQLYAFDVSAACIDFGASEYETVMDWQFQDFGNQSELKYLISTDIVLTGTAQLLLFFDVNNRSFLSPDDAIPFNNGSTTTRAIVPLNQTTVALAPRITSSDHSGFTIERLSFDYRSFSK